MRVLAALAGAALILGACGAGTSAPVPNPLAAPATAGSTAAASPGSVAASAATTQLAPFLTIALTDARSGEKFTLADFKGKVTIVEGMAVW